MPATARTLRLSRPTPSRRRASPSCAATSRRCGGGAARRGCRRGRQLRRRVARRPVHLDPAAFLRTGVDGVHVLLEAVRREGDRAAAGDRRSRRACSRSPRTRSTGPSSRAARARAIRRATVALRCREGCRRALGGQLPRDLRAGRRGHRGSNTYGPYHHPEKLIPLFVTNALDDQPLPLYGDGMHVRDWLFVADHCGGDRPRPAPRDAG